MTNEMNALKYMMVQNELVSKVDGNRNWFIRVEIREGRLVVAYAGRYGRAMLFTEESLQYIAENHVRMYSFTYKKDYKEVLNALMALDPLMPFDYEE